MTSEACSILTYTRILGTENSVELVRDTLEYINVSKYKKKNWTYINIKIQVLLQYIFFTVAFLDITNL